MKTNGKRVVALASALQLSYIMRERARSFHPYLYLQRKGSLFHSTCSFDGKTFPADSNCTFYCAPPPFASFPLDGKRREGSSSIRRRSFIHSCLHFERAKTFCLFAFEWADDYVRLSAVAGPCPGGTTRDSARARRGRKRPSRRKGRKLRPISAPAVRAMAQVLKRKKGLLLGSDGEGRERTRRPPRKNLFDCDVSLMS